MKAPKGADEAVWALLTDWQRVQYLIGFRIGRTARLLKPKPNTTPMPESEPLLHYASMKRWRERLAATEDIVETLRAIPNPPKERP